MKIFLSILLIVFIISFNINLMLSDFYFIKNYNGLYFDYAFSVLNYVKDKGEVPINFLSEKELSHLDDVKLLIKNIKFIETLSFYILSLLCFYLFIRKKYDLIVDSFYFSSFGIFIFLTIILSINLISFDWFFIKFHEILFPQGNWYFSKEDFLIFLFPTNFWEKTLIDFIFILFSEFLLLLILYCTLKSEILCS